MKNKITILILFLSFMSYCQSNIEQRDLSNQKEYESMLILNNSSIIISKYKSATINEIYLIFKTETEFCNDSNGINLTLFSGEKLFFKNAKITCSESETKKFKLIGSLLLSTELYNKLSQTEIIEFSMGGIKVPVKFKEEGENLKDLFKFSEEN